MTKRRTVFACIVIALGLVAVFIIYRLHDGIETKTSTSLVDTSLLTKLRQQSNSDATVQPTRLASDITPPTNQWYSGLVFGTSPEPVYPLPLAFKAESSGFSFNQPTVSTTANTIFGSYAADVSVRPSVTTGFTLTRTDGISIDLTYTAGSDKVGIATLAEGSPYVYYTALKAQTLSISSSALLQRVSASLYQLAVGKHTYGIRLTDGSISGNTIQVPAHATVSLFSVANGLSVSDMASYASPITAVRTTYSTDASHADTTFNYQTTNKQPILYAAFPGQNIQGAKQMSGSYDTIYGKLQLYTGNKFSFSKQILPASSSLNVSQLSADARAQVISSLKSEAASTELTATDSYYGGKGLYRAANLYQLATELKQSDIANSLQSKIDTAFSEWFNPTNYAKQGNRYFYYDTTVKGLVAATPSYGSELFNDHHFHYGYFIYAAAIMAQHSEDFKKRYTPFVNLLAADIASPSASQYFPKQRVFDAYTGHSWASGNGQFADGNNQESNSEAINAWNGLSLWAQVSNNKTLTTEADWLLSNEYASAQQNWIGIDTSASEFSGYTHPLVALNWGGKRDYATFFSNAPNAMLGIQLIPLNPALQALKNQGDAKIESNLTGTAQGAQFSDYLLMYQALKSNSDKQALAAQAAALSAAAIDNGNSRTYMLAWILSQK